MAIFNIGDKVYFNSHNRSIEDKRALSGTVLSSQHQLVVHVNAPIYIDRYQHDELLQEDILLDSEAYEVASVTVDVTHGSYSRYQPGDVYVIADPYIMGLPIDVIVRSISDPNTRFEYRDKSIECKVASRQVSYKVRGQYRPTSEEEVYTFKESELFYL
jgi:hypothetical protein